MNFKNFYKQGTLRISFEVFPPKTEGGIESLFEALTDLKKFDPAFISVTYGAGGSTQGWTRELAIKIQKELKLNAAFHFTCVGSNRDQIKTYVQNLKSEGLNLVVALRGDPPAGEKNFTPAKDGFRYASELVEYLKEIGGFSMAVAGYPEGHVECTSVEDDLKHLKEKVDAGADIIITQLFFDNKDYFDFVARARNMGITVPIIPGIMPVLSTAQIKRISTLIGAKIPDELLKNLEACGEDANAMREVGIKWALKQCLELRDRQVPGIHFYILNKSISTQRILELL